MLCEKCVFESVHHVRNMRTHMCVCSGFVCVSVCHVRSICEVVCLCRVRCGKEVTRGDMSICVL